MTNEILAKRFSTDTEIVPYYDLVDKDGNVVQTDVQVVLKNEVVQEGTPINKSTMLNDNTAQTIWGGNPPEDPTVNEALYVLAAGVGRFVWSVTVTSDGDPVVGMPIYGITSLNETQCYTDVNGTAVGYATTPTATIYNQQNYLDCGTFSQTFNHTDSTVDYVEFDIEIMPSPINITQSGTYSMFRQGNVDIFLCGGGGAGCLLTAFVASLTPHVFAGIGGGGGYTKTQTDVLGSSFLDAVVTIGSGGTHVWDETEWVQLGPSGGTTSVELSDGTLLDALGGEGGYRASSSSSTDEYDGASGGSGSGAVKTYSYGGGGFGANGSDGSNGGNVSGASGGVGQGTTTRAFGELSGELCSSAGGSARMDYEEQTGIQSPGTGGKTAMVVPPTATEMPAYNLSAQHGAGGGALMYAEGRDPSEPVPKDLRVCNGNDGIVIVRWTE